MTSSDAGPAARISFLTTAYRTEDYLGATIASVRAQTRPEWELVVVDNGNDDAIAAIVQESVDPRIRLVRQENRGYTGGVMAAAEVASGEYVCVLDSDDQVVPRFVERMLVHLDAHPEADAVGCDAHLFTDKDDQPFGDGYLRSVAARPPGPDGERLSVEDVLAGRVPFYTSVVRRSAWDAVGGYEPGVVGIDESVLIWLRLTRDYEVWLVPDRLGRYRVRDESLSRDPGKVEEFERALIGTFELFEAQSRSPREAEIVQVPLRRLRYHQALRRARWAFVAGDSRSALRFAREAVAQEPTLRAASVVLLLRLAPRALRRVYPLKQWFTELVARTRRRILL